MDLTLRLQLTFQKRLWYLSFSEWIEANWSTFSQILFKPYEVKSDLSSRVPLASEIELNFLPTSWKCLIVSSKISSCVAENRRIIYNIRLCPARLPFLHEEQGVKLDLVSLSTTPSRLIHFELLNFVRFINEWLVKDLWPVVLWEKNDVSLKTQFSPKVNRGSLPQIPVIHT